MKIYIDSTVTNKGSSTMALSEGFPKLLMPGGMCGSNVKRCYVNSTEFIEYTLINENQSIDEFIKEFGAFGKTVEQSDAQKMMDLILSDNVRLQEINYADMSDVAVLARAVLADDPHCYKKPFKYTAFEKALDLGFSKETFKHCIMLYA